MSFSAKTLDFLVENRLNDNKEWFRAHKDDYEEYVKKPMTELTEALKKYVLEIDPEISVARISRIYRDARYAKDSVFRKNMWSIFSRSRDLYRSYPAFYFDISPNGLEYGYGYYQAGTATMQGLRELVINDSAAYISAQAAFDEQDVFEIYGDMYKRPKYICDEKKSMWVNRKTIGLSTSSKDWELIFSDKLAEKIGEDYMKIAAVYDLFIRSEEKAAEKR